MKLYVKFLLLGLIASFIIACDSSNKSSTNSSAMLKQARSTIKPSDSIVPPELIDSEWILVDLAGTPVLPAKKPTLVFSANGISGNGSCNHFGGTVVIKNETIKISRIVSTAMACGPNPHDRGKQEMQYLKILTAATHYIYEPSTLLIYANGFDKPLRFTYKSATK